MSYIVASAKNVLSYIHVAKRISKTYVGDMFFACLNLLTPRQNPISVLDRKNHHRVHNAVLMDQVRKTVGL